ncbi:hypothetical protein ACFPM7_18080 [Actinokineospora guangxiensis]|uniref:Uncharacterized protein n=1 Tax=Actinokineospora guangxiensis TaxID=1490288 RepID=A0ABW0ETS8_9PSEU
MDAVSSSAAWAEHAATVIAVAVGCYLARRWIIRALACAIGFVFLMGVTSAVTVVDTLSGS